MFVRQNSATPVESNLSGWLSYASLPATFLLLSGRLAAGQGGARRSGGTMVKGGARESALASRTSNASGTRGGPTASRGAEADAKGSAPELITGANSSGPNIVYRALTPADAASIETGTGLAAKAPNGTWTAAEHGANAGPGAGGAAANSPWISTTRLLDVAKGYEDGNGIVGIDLSKLGSFQTEVWQTAPRVDGVAGLPYHRSIWAQEVTIFQEIPQSAIIKVPGKR